MRQLQEDELALACILDMSSNGTFVNAEKLERNAPHALCADDILSFATADPENDKFLAFRVVRYDAALFGVPEAPAPEARAAEAASGEPGLKRLRGPDATEVALVAHLHDANQSLRGQSITAAAELSTLQARLAVLEAAALEQRAEAAAQLDALRQSSVRERDEAARVAQYEQARLNAESAEAVHEAAAQRSRAEAAVAELRDAESAAVAARQERDAAHSQLQEARASAEASEARLRETARFEREAAAAAQAELKRVEAELAEERRAAGAGAEREARLEADASALQASRDEERAAKLAAQTSVAAAVERAASVEARLARLMEETRGAREGVALDAALGQRLLDFFGAVREAAGAVEPHARALQLRVAAQLQSESVLGLAATQLVGQRASGADAAHHGMTQCMDMRYTEREAAPPAAPLAEPEEDEDMALGTYPTASLQAAMEAEAAAKRNE